MTIANKWTTEYTARGALWLHDGNPKRPHALLTSGKHSDGFFNSGLVTQNPLLVEAACKDLLALADERKLGFGLIERVVSPAMGAITFGFELARQVSHRRGHTCDCSYAEKVGEGPGATFVFKRIPPLHRELVVVAEDVITTGSSTEKVLDAAIAHGAQPVDCVLCLVNRSGQTHIRELPIVALIDKKMNDWAADECPLCAAGSEAIRPKEADNWHRLNTNYAA